jgi:alpha-beta hydrolase superfamily lysophospholipase
MKPDNFEFQVAQLTLKGQYYKPKETQSVVVLVHGMGEYSRRYERTVVPFFLKSSIAVISYDQFGHGHSQGKKGHHPGYDYLLDSIEHVISKASVLFPSKPVFLYGHSMGGNVVINFTLRRKHQLKGVIATSPFLRLAFDPPGWKMFFGKMINKIYPSITMPNELDLQFLSKDQTEIDAYKNDPLIHDRVSTRYSLDMMAAGEWAIQHASSLRIPMLLMHGNKDQITSHLASKEFADKAQGMVTFVAVTNGYHELHHDLEKDMLLTRIGEWIQEQLTKP